MKRRVIAIGLDGFDAGRTERLLAAGALPNLHRLRTLGSFQRLGTTSPAQTPVAWSTFATGTNPGGHGIFDFLRRDPVRLRPEPGLFRVQWKGGFQPPRAVNLRGGTPFWDVLGRAGVPSVVLRHPCTFPAVAVRGRTLAGVGVPDLRGGFGSTTFYTDEEGVAPGEAEQVLTVGMGADGRAATWVPGPLTARGEVRAAVELRLDAATRTVTIAPRGEGREVRVEEGAWSPWLRVRFHTSPLQTARGLVRFFLASTAPLRLYGSPVHYDPKVPPFPISYPWDYAAQIERELGPFHTLGMTEGHGGLNNGRLDEEAFLDQCDEVLDERTRLMHHELDRFKEGFFFFLFDTPDRVQHMLWRCQEPDHPANAVHGPRPDLAGAIDDHYRDCDRIVGEVMDHLGDDTLLLVLSDHGFTSFRRELHVNQWLHARGLLALRSGSAPAAEGPDLLEDVDWSRTRAYGVGMAGIYLNVRGREAQGIVAAEEAPALAEELAAALRGLPDPATGQTAVADALPGTRVYRGPFAADAPDVVLHCAPGYRVSGRSAMGAVPDTLFSDNVQRWAGDHVVDPAAVPGVLFASEDVREEAPHLVDMAPTILGVLGRRPGEAMEGRALLP